MTLKILMLKGLPASCKSTYANKLLKSEPGKWKRVNKDCLRDMLDDGEYNKDNEYFVNLLQMKAIYLALKNSKSVICDNTNLSSSAFKRLCKIADDIGDVIVEEKNFYSTVDECIERDARRSGRARVGEEVIKGLYNRYNLKYGLPEERKLYFEKNEIITAKQDTSKEHAILVDLDGCVSLFNKQFDNKKIETIKGAHFRNPYDASTADKDMLNEPVAEAVRAMKDRGYKIIFISGRQDKYNTQTVEFLNKHFDFEYDLFMRKTDDLRKDSIVKKEIYESEIKDKHYVMFILDDRKQVIDMWRQELGLTAFQVNYGDF